MKKFILFTLAYWAACMLVILFADRPLAIAGGFTAIYVIVGLYELAKLFPLCHDHGSDEQDEDFEIGFEAGGHHADMRPLPTPWSENGIEDDKLEYKDGEVSVPVKSISFPSLRG